MADTLSSDIGLVYNNSNTSKATAVTVTNDYSGALKDYPSGIITINAASRTNAIQITGNSKANKIFGGSGNDTLAGSSGNDTLTGGDGDDIFIYSAGKDVITDFVAQDTLKIASGSISSYSFSGNDANFKIGSGSVKISGGKNTAITVVDSKNSLKTYDGGLIYDGTVAKAKAMTVSAAYGNTLAAYGASVVTIDASSRTKALDITGNAAANKIIGTSGNDTINGGAGNDTITGGKGNDVFIYEAGNDVITDYAAGSDTIKIASGSISSYSFSGSDAVFKIDKGSLKISGGKNSAITIIDAENNLSVFQGGLIYDSTVAKAKSVTVTSAYGNTLASYGASVQTIDASAKTAAINITGNAANNFISGGTKNDVIDGGKGNDSISGGKGNDTLTGGIGNDIFIYSKGDGNDVITDYVAGEDKIKIVSGSVTGYSVKNSDAILKIGSGAITLKNAGSNAISVLDEDDNLIVYNNGLIYNNSKISRADAVTITSDFDGEFGNYGASVETIDASARTKAIEITGNTGANYILGGKAKDTIDGGKGADTIIGGKGNDLLTGGKGNDVFYFSGADGNDTITDYSAGDIISVEGSVTYSTKNSDAILKIGTGNVTLQGAAETAITIVGADSVASIYSGENISTETYTGGAGAAETVTVTETVTVNVTLPPETETVEVTVTVGGGGGGSLIEGTTDNDTLIGTAGNDTFTGNAGDDIFVYGGGYDIITDYGTGNDSISIGANSVSGGAVIGNDVILEIGDGALKINNAKDKLVTILSGENVTQDRNGEIFGATYTLPADSSNFTLAAYNNSVGSNYSNIDATNVTSRIGIYGDSLDNIIRAGSVGSYLYGGRGNDTLYFGAGTDAVYYYQYGGNDIVYNFQSGDEIHIDDNKTGFGNVALADGDLIISTVDESSITLKNLKEQIVRIWDAKTWRWYTGTFADATISGAGITLDSTYQSAFNSSWYADNPDTIDASAVVNTITITGNDHDNYIRASKAGDYIYAGQGNDTISLGAGNSYIYYEQYGGSDVILNYKSGARIYFDDSKTGVENISVSGSDLIINTIDEETVTLKNVKTQTIYFYNNKDGVHYSGTLANATISNKNAKLASTYEGTFYAPFYADEISTIDASAVSNFISIQGGDDSEVIRAGKAGGRIYAGQGDDTISLGAGEDHIYYYQYGGSDTIYNYKTGDQIAFDDSKAYFYNFKVDGGDLIIKTSEEEKFTLKDVKTQTVSLWDAKTWRWYTGTFANATLDGGSATLGTTYTGTFNAAWYSENPDTINASTNRNSIVVYGNDNANVMYGGEGTTTICAGKGDDTIYGGSGVDKIYFYKDDGNEIVFDIDDGDQVVLNDCSATSVSVSGTDVIITTNYAETITLKDGTGKNIWISGQNWKTYDAEEISGSSALFADDNFISGNELDSIIDSGAEITNLNFSATNNFENLAPEISYASDK